MDELLHHCLRELAFDGDLGCNVSRLRNFVLGFYAHANASHNQNLDDAYCNFVWSLVVAQPTVLVGLLPEGVTSEVWIAPQVGAKRKAIASGVELTETLPPKLEPIPEPKTTPLEILLKSYGDRLRVAADPNTIFSAITGSHIRSSRLSPTVYTSLQIITRGRDAGVSVVELGKQSGYDQKTCFYLVKQLTDLDIVLKVRRAGVGANFCIHKYFYERSSSWKAILEEESRAENLQTKHQGAEYDYVDEDGAVEESHSLDFTPIDTRHLSSFPLIKARVIKLLQASRNHIHASTNILITLGFSNPTKTDRRFFDTRIREMIQQGLIEKVVVPSNKKNDMKSLVKCLRLVDRDSSASPDDGDVIVDHGDELEDITPDSQSGLKLNVTVHKQIVDLLEESGTNGMTLNDISASLHEFDKRTIELLLSRAEKFQPPSHLLDLHVVGIMESIGRERHHRYYTVHNYRSLVMQEELDKDAAAFNDMDLDNVGGFNALHSDCFYKTTEELAHHCDSRKWDLGSSSKRKLRVLKNPILPDGQVKRGRPLKTRPEVADRDTSSQSAGRKRKRADSDSGEDRDATEVHAVGTKAAAPHKKRKLKMIAEVVLPAPIKRGRGRPPKPKASPVLNSAMTIEEETLLVPKRRIRQARRSKLPQSVDILDEVTPPPRLVLASGPLLSQPNEPEDAANIGHAGSNILFPTPPIPDPIDMRQSVPDTNPSRASIVDQDPGVLTSTPVTGVDGQTLACNEDNATVSRVAHADTPENKDISTAELSGSIISRPTTTPSANFTRINVSHLRRENEIMRLIENAGGISNVHTKVFQEAHLKLLETLSKAGEATSAPIGTRTDKKTLNLTLNNLERRGRIKLLTTSVTSQTGLNRPTLLAYLPQIDGAQLTDYLNELSRSIQQPSSLLSSFVKIDEPLEYGAAPGNSRRPVPLPLQLLQLDEPGDGKESWSKNLSRANQLLSLDDGKVRDILLAERSTFRQLVGFLIGNALRCRCLHLSALRFLESSTLSSYVVSSEKRIIDISLFLYDITLELYCSMVSPVGYDENLTTFYSIPENRQMLIRELPESLQSSLHVGRSRARTRFLDILETLHSLGLVTPLQASASSTPSITCSPNGDYPTKFELAELDGWTVNSPTIAPIYWLINENAPIYLWCSSETQPPFWKDVSISSYAEGVAYWKDLQEAFTNPQIQVIPQAASTPVVTAASERMSHSFRRSVAWRTQYSLSWYQIQYLKKHIGSSGSTPLQTPSAEERDAQLDKICWVTSAPREAITEFFSSTSEKLVHEAGKLKKEQRKQQRTEETKVSLAKKAEQARLQRGDDWAALLARLHPEVLPPSAAIRIERIRNRFLLAGSIKEISKWEKEIQEALHEANLASSRGLKLSAKRRFPKPLLPASTTASPGPSEISLNDLILSQGPSLPATTSIKRKRKKDDPAGPEDKKKVTRRHRFQWNDNFDELARDASAIIRARCRNQSRLDWAAFEQVFPTVPRNTVRQRLTHIKETPGNEAYLRRLEDAWYDLWVKNRGTAALPDDDPTSPSNFDLVKHLEFFRKNLDKASLRVGCSNATEVPIVVIPSDVQQLQDQFEITSREQAAPTWDFMWNATIEETREKRFKRLTFSRLPDDFPLPLPPQSDESFVAEAAVKIVMGTPPELYNSDQASSLLRSRGSESISSATRSLLSRGVLSKLLRDPKKSQPGRQLKISDSNQNSLGGSITRDTFQDAVLLEELDVDDLTWHEWPLTATDGDCAALLQLVHEDQADIDIDTTLPKTARQELDWNSKKADDDQIETSISVRYRFSIDNRDGDNLQTPVPVVVASSPEADRIDTEYEHGLNARDETACCRKNSLKGLVDCSACLKIAWNYFCNLDTNARQTAQEILDLVCQGKEHGIKKSELTINLAVATDMPVSDVLNQMVTADIPQVFWAGYDSLVLVSAEHAARWSVATGQDPPAYILPRRWLDIKGQKVVDFWQAALRAVIGSVVFRPGITQREIRWRLRQAYDRQEVTEIIEHLFEEGYLQMRIGDSGSKDMFSPYDEEEEAQIHWFIGDRHWYQV